MGRLLGYLLYLAGIAIAVVFVLVRFVHVHLPDSTANIVNKVVTPETSSTTEYALLAAIFFLLIAKWM